MTQSRLQPLQSRHTTPPLPIVRKTVAPSTAAWRLVTGHTSCVGRLGRDRRAVVSGVILFDWGSGSDRCASSMSATRSFPSLFGPLHRVATFHPITSPSPLIRSALLRCACVLPLRAVRGISSPFVGKTRTLLRVSGCGRELARARRRYEPSSFAPFRVCDLAHDWAQMREVKGCFRALVAKREWDDVCVMGVGVRLLNLFVAHSL